MTVAPTLGAGYVFSVRILSRSMLRDFWETGAGAEARQPLLAWFKEVEAASWNRPADIKRLYRSADFVGDGGVIFNIGGNRYRLIVWVKYSAILVRIKWVGTHAAYDEVDVASVGLKGKTRRKSK